MITKQGVKVKNINNSLKAGERGTSLLEDFILREKITHFDHERIPECIVHSRGSGAHGYFELQEDQNEFFKAGIFTDTSRETPVFVRFSTVVSSKGSADLARDVCGFSVKFGGYIFELDKEADTFIKAIAKHRNWNREAKAKMIPT